MVRVEEELKHQRELIKQILVEMDKRFDALIRRIDRFLIWSFGITISCAGIIIAVLRFWPDPS